MVARVDVGGSLFLAGRGQQIEYLDEISNDEAQRQLQSTAEQ